MKVSQINNAFDETESSHIKLTSRQDVSYVEPTESGIQHGWIEYTAKFSWAMLCLCLNALVLPFALAWVASAFIFGRNDHTGGSDDE